MTETRRVPDWAPDDAKDKYTYSSRGREWDISSGIYCINGQVRHYYIPGGNVSSPVAQARWSLVQKARQSGKSNAEIVKMIQMWQS